MPILHELRTWMKSNKLNQRQVSIKLGCNESMVSRWLSTSNPSVPSRLWTKEIERVIT